MAHLPNEPSKDSFVNDTFLTVYMTHWEQCSDDCAPSKTFINLSSEDFEDLSEVNFRMIFSDGFISAEID